MDRPLDGTFVKRRSRRRAALAGGLLMLTSAVFAWGPSLLRPSLSRGRLRTARVASGPITSSITASGTVLPEVGEVLASPVEARVLRILKRAGARVADLARASA